MKRFSRDNQRFFKACGQRGGRARAQRLSAMERSAIAAQAATTRWHKHDALLASVRLTETPLDNPVYVAEILSEGSLSNWRSLYQEIANHPFGESAAALQRVLTALSEYGVTPLWRGILRTVQAGG